MTRRNRHAGEGILSMRRSIAAAAVRAKFPTILGQHDLRHRRVAQWLGEGQSAALVEEATWNDDRRPARLATGTLDLLILKALSLEPMHGWAISERIHQVLRETLQIPQGSLFLAALAWGARHGLRRG